MIYLLFFLVGIIFGIIISGYLIGSKLDKKFDTIDEFKEWIARIK